MLNIIEKELFEYVRETREKEKTTIYIPHVVNNKNVFGAGFVVPFAKHYPISKASYHQWFNDTTPQLGQIKIIQLKADPDLFVVHMLAQNGIGGKRPLKYDALVDCMRSVANKIQKGERIIAPAFGSGLAGGSFDFIQALIEDIWDKLDTTICRVN